MAGVQSIERAFSVLRALSVGPAGVTELAERLDLPKSTVARLLGALEEEQAVEQVAAGGEYQLGGALADLAGASAPGRNLVAAARPHLLELTAALGETAGLAVAEGNSVLYLDQSEATDEDVQVRDWSGELAPMHTVSSGLVLLAGKSPAFIDRYLSRDLEAPTASTVADTDAIRARLEKIEVDGYVWVYEEFVPGLNSVAAAVPRRSGRPTVAVHVHGPAYRFPGDTPAADITAAVTDAAGRLGEQLS
jgi:DNA-binding IclR family transcriptional regulator